MSERPQDDGRPTPLSRPLVALMAAILYIALIVFTWGVTSFVLDRDVIEITDAGPLIGPAMVLACTALVFWLVLRARVETPLRGAVYAAAGSVIIGPGVGAAALSAGVGVPYAFLVYFGELLLTPFTLTATLIASMVVCIFTLVGRRR